MTDSVSLKKIYWAKARQYLSKIDPTFVSIVDKLNVDKSFPLFLASYPYGSIIADTTDFFLPPSEGKPYLSLTNSENKNLLKHLGYGKNSMPMGVVLEKKVEYSVDIKDQGLSVP